MSFKCVDCPVGGRCDRCKRRNRDGERERYSSEVPKGLARIVALEVLRLAGEAAEVAGELDDPYLLPDDGIHDGHAIDIVVHGRRHERLTYDERVEAATEIVRHGGSAKDICVNLSLPVVITEIECQTSQSPTVRKLLGCTE
jgi:hypothetical protein